MSKLHFVFSALLLAACSSDDSATDAGPDAAKDATADAAKDATILPDASADVKPDAPFDAPADVVNDVAIVDATADAGSSWHTPTCDGVIGTNEYGASQYQTTSGTQTWYVTWDATNLYVALDNAMLTEANVLYVGYSGNGLTTTQTYDGTGGTLPFAADGVVYAKTGYQEAREGAADAGSWSNPVTNAITFCSSGSTREEVIPWTALGTSSIPAKFRFLAYATSNTGFVYGQIPVTNTSGNIGTSATFAHDFYVASTSNGTGSFPFDVTE